ncbi:MAG: dihydrolipoyl dehydrogenase [Gemmataceae bacterium]
MADIRTKQTQLLVIGAGPGGYPAAFAAADHGLKVTMVDADPQPGGVCLNRGCIPSKALLHVAKLVHEAKAAAAFGITFGEPKFDLDKLRTFVQKSVIAKLNSGIVQLCKARGVEYIKAKATFEDSQSVSLSGETTGKVKFDHCIVATGSVPAMPRIFNIGDQRVMDSTGALLLPDVPKKLLVIGGGYIGLEIGQVYAALGSKVTVVEALDTILALADRDLVKPLEDRLKKDFEAIHISTKVASLKATPPGIVAALEGKEVPAEATFDRVLVAVGRRPNSSGFGLDKTKVELDERGFIKVDRQRRTRDPHILAIGDVAGDPGLAHKATAEAKVAVEALLGEPAAIPAVVFTDPEIAWCGLTEREAKEQNVKVDVLKFPWAASGKAISQARTDGLTKLLVEPVTQRVLGMGIVGVGAGDLISEGVLAVEMAAVARDVAESIHPHPTVSETIMESAELALGSATHLAKPRAKGPVG